MPEVVTNVDQSQEHDACPRRDLVADSCSPNVLAETFRVAFRGSRFNEHGCPDHDPHGGEIIEACSTVTVNGKQLAVVGSLLVCDSVGITTAIATGRSTVLVGEGRILQKGTARG